MDNILLITPEGLWVLTILVVGPALIGGLLLKYFSKSNQTSLKKQKEKEIKNLKVDLKENVITDSEIGIEDSIQSEILFQLTKLNENIRFIKILILLTGLLVSIGVSTIVFRS